MGQKGVRGGVHPHAHPFGHKFNQTALVELMDREILDCVGYLALPEFREEF